MQNSDSGTLWEPGRSHLVFNLNENMTVIATPGIVLSSWGEAHISQVSQITITEEHKKND